MNDSGNVMSKNTEDPRVDGEEFRKKALVALKTSLDLAKSAQEINRSILNLTHTVSARLGAIEEQLIENGIIDREKLEKRFEEIRSSFPRIPEENS